MDGEGLGGRVFFCEGDLCVIGEVDENAFEIAFRSDLVSMLSLVDNNALTEHGGSICDGEDRANEEGHNADG